MPPRGPGGRWCAGGPGPRGPGGRRGSPGTAAGGDEAARGFASWPGVFVRCGAPRKSLNPPFGGFAPRGGGARPPGRGSDTREEGGAGGPRAAADGRGWPVGAGVLVVRGGGEQARSEPRSWGEGTPEAPGGEGGAWGHQRRRGAGGEVPGGAGEVGQLAIGLGGGVGGWPSQRDIYPGVMHGDSGGLSRGPRS